MSSQTSALMLSGMSFLTFFSMNIERYLSIVCPYFHLNHVTKQRCLIFSSLIWIVCIVTAITPIFGANIQHIVITLAFIIITGTIFIYVSIYYVPRKRRNYKHRARTKSGGQSDLIVVDPPVSREVLPENSNKIVPFLQDMQLAKTYLLVGFSSLFLNLPNAVTLAMFSGEIQSINVAVHIKVWTVTLVAMNSTANCLIFFWSNKRLRNEGIKTCKTFIKQ